MSAVSDSSLFEALTHAIYFPDEQSDIGADQDLPGLWELRNQLSNVIQAARKLRDECDTEITLQLDGAAARFGNSILRCKPELRYRVLNPRTFWDWVLAVPKDAEALFDENRLRVGALKRVAERRGYDPRVIVDSLLDVERSEDKLSVTPFNKAPQWCQRLQPGEVKRRASHQ